MKRKCNYCTRFQFSDDRVLCPKGGKNICHLYDPNKYAMDREMIDLKDKAAELIEAIDDEPYNPRLKQLANQLAEMI